MTVRSIWEIIVRLVRGRTSGRTTGPDNVQNAARNTGSWRSNQRKIREKVSTSASGNYERSTPLVIGRDCDLCPEKLDGRGALVTHYLQTHKIPQGIRGGGTGGIGCPVCHYEYELVADQVLHYVGTHSG